MKSPQGNKKEFIHELNNYRDSDSRPSCLSHCWVSTWGPWNRHLFICL